jgi:hypothetical protein
MRFADAKPDGRAIVYAHIQADPLVARIADLLADATTTQRVLSRAAMNGESTDPDTWRAMFPSLFGPAAPAPGDPGRDRSEAIVEALTERLLAARTGPVRRERRILFDGRPAEIHPYDVTVEAEPRSEAWDCKWGARGIKADVIHQLDDARRGAADEEAALVVGLVVFDARRSCEVRLVRERGPVGLEGLKLIALEGLDRLAGRKPA